MGKKLIFNLIIVVSLLFFMPFFVSAVENCTSYHETGCYEGNSYWFDSCGNPEYVALYCNWNQECINGECVNLCGNGVCNSDKGETCSSCNEDCACGSNEKCEWGQCQTYCGNGVCDGNENCWNCGNDCACRNDERCESGVCNTYCGNGKCESDENCQTCYDCSCEVNEDCKASSPRADSRGCVNRCGNGIFDRGENCQTCPEDVGCSEGSYCYNSNCVECFKDSHCESRETATGKFICSSDFKNTLEKIIKSQGICQNNHCSGENIETTKQSSHCGNKLCQDGKCGCKEEFAACLKSGKCEKQSILEDGQSCSCYFQCQSNYCNPTGKCVKAINAPLTVNKNVLKVGETTKLTISGDNALDEDISTKITLNTASGFIMSGVIGSAACSGNQCTGGEVMVSSKGMISTTVDLIAQNYGKHTLTATITPTIDGQQYPKEEKVEITVINPGDGICSEGETSQNACSDCKCPEASSIYEYVCKSNQSCKKSIKWVFYIILASIVGLIALMIYSVPRAKSYYLKLSEKRDTRKAEKEQKEFTERKKIVNALYKISKKIKLDNPLPVKEIISKARLENADPEIVHEEYIHLLDRMKKVKTLSGTEKKEAQKILEKPQRNLAQRFCTGCGATIRESSKFCTKCGRTVKK